MSVSNINGGPEHMAVRPIVQPGQRMSPLNAYIRIQIYRENLRVDKRLAIGRSFDDLLTAPDRNNPQ